MTRLHPVRMLFATLLILLIVIPVAAEAQQEEHGDHALRGYASWYAGKFQGRLTANGERFDTNQLTAAHKTLPFDSVVEVRHIGNGRTVTVRINDRGPFVEGRVIDLSRAAAEQLDMTAEGIAQVELTILEKPELRFTVQVASFASAANAQRLVSRLRDAGVAAVVEEAGTVTRVVVSDLDESGVDETVSDLTSLGYRDPLIREQRN